MQFNTKSLRVAGAVLLAASLWTLPASAQDRPRHHGMRGGMAGGRGTMLPLIMRGADLTADQKTQVQQIMANHRETVRDLLGQLRAAQEQVSSRLLTAGPVSEADLAPQHQQIAQLRNLLAEEHLKLVLEVRSILTPDQLAKVAQLQTQMKARRSEMKEGRKQPRQSQQ